MMTPAEYALSITGKSRFDLNLTESGEWCAETVSHIMKKTVDPQGKFKNMSCNKMMDLMQNSDEVYEPDDMIKASDFLFFDHDRDRDPLRDSKPLDHVAVVVQVDPDGMIWYVDGNGDSTNLIKKRRRHISSFNFTCKYPDFYMRFKCLETPAPELMPDKPSENSEISIKRGDVGYRVTLLQTLLQAKGFSVGSCGVDGDFGDDTESAVKAHQNKVNLPATGVADEETILALFR